MTIHLVHDYLCTLARHFGKPDELHNTDLFVIFRHHKPHRYAGTFSVPWALLVFSLWAELLLTGRTQRGTAPCSLWRVRLAISPRITGAQSGVRRARCLRRTARSVPLIVSLLQRRRAFPNQLVFAVGLCLIPRRPDQPHGCDVFEAANVNAAMGASVGWQTDDARVSSRGADLWSRRQNGAQECRRGSRRGGLGAQLPPSAPSRRWTIGWAPHAARAAIDTARAAILLI